MLYYQINIYKNYEKVYLDIHSRQHTFRNQYVLIKFSILIWGKLFQIKYFQNESQGLILTQPMACKKMVNKMLDDKVKVTETVYAHSRYTDKEGKSMRC